MTQTLVDKGSETLTPAPKTAAPADGWPVEARFAAYVMLAAGAVFRICKWAHYRSLWLDELYLSQSILTRGFRDLLFKPLENWQAAPAGFLALDRLGVDIFGGGERILRLPSLLAGLVSLPLFYALAKRVLPLRAALMAILLFCVLSPLIYYSQETKQYSCDVAVTLGILLAAVNLWLDGPTLRRLGWYAAAGGIGLFFSHPAGFVLAGSGLVLAIGGSLKARREGGSGKTVLIWLGGLAAVGVICGGLEWLNYWAFLRPTLQNKVQTAGLITYWEQPEINGFMARDPHEVLPWVWRTFYRIVHEPATMNINSAGLGLTLAIVGAAALFVGKRRWSVLMILSPLPFALAASLMRRYPFADRIALYMVPAIVMLMAAGLDWLWSDNSMGRAMAAMLMLCIIGGAAVVGAMDGIWQGEGREETEEAYTYIRDNWQNGDVLFISHYAPMSFDYYAPKVGLTGLTQIPLGPPGSPLEASLAATANSIESDPGYRKAYRPKPNKPAKPDVQGYVCVQPDRSQFRLEYQHPDQYRELYLTDADNLLRPPANWHWPKVKRVWVLFTHTWDQTGFQTELIYLPEMDRQADRDKEHQDPGASVYMYQVPDTGGSSSAKPDGQ